MKQFLIKFFKISLLFLIVCLSLEFIIFQNNVNPYSYKYNLLKNEENVEVIITGNSHLGFGIIADDLSFNAINIANKGRELETDLDILTIENLIKKRNLKTLLIPISYYTLFKEIDHNNSYFISQKRLYYNFYEIEKYSQGFIKNRLLINEPFRELIDNSPLLFFKNSKKFSLKGWRANNTKFKFDGGDKGIESKLKGVEKALLSKNILNKNIDRLKSLYKICNDLEIKLIVVIPPYSSYYFKISKYKYNKLINKILNSNFKNLIVINSNDFMTSNIEYYENSDHLNVKGATLFTKKIDSILRTLLQKSNNKHVITSVTK